MTQCDRARPSPPRRTRLATLLILLCAGSSPAWADTESDVVQLRAQRDWIGALARLQQAHPASPAEADRLYRLQVLTVSDLGDSGLAWQLYQARPPLFDAGERERLQANLFARWVNWAMVRSASEDDRLDAARQAEAIFQDYLREHAIGEAQAPLRMRFDRLILLNRLGRHDETVAAYRQLSGERQPVPGYALGAVADSLLAQHHPREAGALTRQALQNDPDNHGLHIQLAYAELEAERPRQALAELERYRQTQPPWTTAATGSRKPNWNRYDADLTHAMVSGYAGDLPGAQAAVEALLDRAPGNAGLQSALGSVYAMRGWSERALERFRMASTLDPRATSARIGEAESWMALQRDDLARPILAQLRRDHAESHSVERLERAWRRHRGWQGRVYTERGRSDGSDSPLGSDDAGSGIELASPLIGDRWRIAAKAEDRWADFRGERIHRRYAAAGLQYGYDRLEASLWAGRPRDGIGGTLLEGELFWRIDDRFRVEAAVARNDPEASLQARAAGISADSLRVGGRYRRDERGEASVQFTHARYDDGNLRDTLSARFSQRVFSRPAFNADAVGGVYLSRNSRDDAPYYNPARDAGLDLGLRLQQLVWRRYERSFQHRLTLSAGPYWERGYGSAWVPSLRYEHEWQFATGRSLLYGVSWSRPVYDGQRERHVSFDLGFRWGE